MLYQHQEHRRQLIKKKHNLFHKIASFVKGDFALLAILKENCAPTDNLCIIVQILEKPY